MSTCGEKRKLVETDIPIDGDTPLKQHKSDGTIQQLRDQLEFYFGDSNLSLDKHIIETSKMEINEGFFPISGLLAFKMIKQRTQSIDLIIAAIESSSKLQLNDNKNGVRRHPQCGEPPTKQQIHERSIFAKGFHPRITMDELSMFWKNETDATDATASNVLSVRRMKESVIVGIAENNKPKILRRFLGNCSVELSSIDLAQELSKMTFTHCGRVIRCGMIESYWRDDIEWKITKQYYPFESNKVLFIREIPTYSTYADIKNWICNALYSKQTKKKSGNKVEYVYKELNSGIAYVRFHTESDITNCVQCIKKKPLMGQHPKVTVLNDEQSSKIWNKIAQKPLNANKDVQIKTTSISFNH